MLMRRLLAVFGPILLCLLTCVAFMWLDRWLPPGDFFQYTLKGVLLGLCVALALPAAGISAKNTGLTGMLWIGAGLLLLTLAYQYLETIGAVHVPALVATLSINGQVVLIESTVMGYLALTASMNRRRRPAAKP
jgi:hypothetical protein